MVEGVFADQVTFLDDDFLKETVTPKDRLLTSAMLPDPPMNAQDDITTTSRFLQGFRCPICGRLSSRYVCIGARRA
jgi:hypothetical protein